MFMKCIVWVEMHCSFSRFIFKLVIAGIEKYYWFLYVDPEFSYLTELYY